MPRASAGLALVVLIFAAFVSQQSPKNIWEKQYKDRSAVDMAAQFENDSRPVYRHRADIIRLLELSPGMSVAEIGAGSGFLSRLAARSLGRSGRIIATELDPKMVDYMNERARREGLTNFKAITGHVGRTGLDASSLDAILIVNTFSFFDRPREMMLSVAEAMKPGGVLVVVDFPPSDGSGTAAETVIGIARAAGLLLIDRSEAVPGHYALRFRKTP